MSRIEDAIKIEAEEYARRVLGQLYDLLPDSVKREVEREYISRRSAELGVGAVEKAKVALPLLLVGGVLLALFMMPKGR